MSGDKLKISNLPPEVSIINTKETLECEKNPQQKNSKNMLNKIFGGKILQNKLTKPNVCNSCSSIDKMIHESNLRISSKVSDREFLVNQPPPRPPPPVPRRFSDGTNEIPQETTKQPNFDRKYPTTPLPCRSTLFSRKSRN